MSASDARTSLGLTLQRVRHGANSLDHVLLVLGGDFASCDQFVTFFHFLYCSL